jgi:YVTN family beta-propeller protein
LSFTGHASPVVIAHDTETFKEVWRSEVGADPEKLGVHPAGTFVYAILTKEGAVAVLEAATGKVVRKISLGTNPTGIFVRRIK